jgi:hypothetical protein
VKNLVSGLLDRKEERLSSAKYRTACGQFVFPADAADIKDHEFFANLRWETYNTLPHPYLRRLVPKPPSPRSSSIGAYGGDSILRDQEFGPDALMARKAASFMGYGFYRPRDV